MKHSTLKYSRASSVANAQYCGEFQFFSIYSICVCTSFQTLGKNLKLIAALRSLYCEPTITRQSSLY